MFETKQLFSIRTFAQGAASVLIGAFLLGNAGLVQAEVQTSVEQVEFAETTIPVHYINYSQLDDLEKSFVIQEQLQSDKAIEDGVAFLVYQPKNNQLPQTGQGSKLLSLASMATGILIAVYALRKGKKQLLAVIVVGSLMPTTSWARAGFLTPFLSSQVHVEPSSVLAPEVEGYCYVGYLDLSRLPEGNVKDSLRSLLPNIKPNMPEKSEILTENESIEQHSVAPIVEESANEALISETSPTSPSIWEVPTETLVNEEVPSSPSIWEVPTETLVNEEAPYSPGIWEVPTETLVNEEMPPSPGIWEVPTETLVNEEAPPSPGIWEVPTETLVNEEMPVAETPLMEEQIAPQPTEPEEVAPIDPAQPEDPVAPQPIVPPAPVITFSDSQVVTEIPFETEYIDDPTMWEGEEVVGTNGENGQLATITRTQYIDGQPQPNPIVETRVVEKPVNKVIRKGTKPTTRKESVETERDIPFETETLQDPNLWVGETVEVPGEVGKEKVITTTTYIKDVAQPDPKVEIVPIKAPVNNIIKQGTKEKIVPTLEILTFNEKTAEELTTLNDRKLDKTVEVGFNLEKDQNVVNKKYVLKKNGQVVKESDLLASLSLADLEHDVEYTVDLTVGYDIGDGIKQLTASKKFILELKKIEIKDVREYKLYKVDAKKNVRINSLSTIPSDTDKYYVEVLSDKNKPVVLPVEKIEEVNGDFKITLKAEDLVEKRAGAYEINHDFLFPKTKVVTATAGAVGVRTFSDLITKLQEHKDNSDAKIELLADVSATEVDKNTDLRYVPGMFKAQFNGNGFMISDTTKPLFDTLNNAKISNVKIKDANIQLVEENSGILASKIENDSKVTNLEVAGKVGGLTHVGGVTGVLDNSSITNLKVDAEVFRTQNVPNYYRKPHNGKHIGGVAGFVSNNANLEKAHIKVAIKPNYASGNGTTGGVFARVTGRVTTGKLDKIYVEGSIDPVDVQGNSGGIIGNGHNSFMPISNVITAVDVKRGNVVRHTNGWFTDGIFVVEDKAKGTNTNVNHTKIQSSDVDAKLAEWGLEKIVNHYEYKEAKHADLLHTNTEKFIPLYNTSQIEKNAIKLAAHGKFTTNKVLSVLPTKAGKLVSNYTNPTDIDGVVVHFEDGTISNYNATFKEKYNSLLHEYDISDLGIIYTPESFVNHTDFVAEIAEILNSVNVDAYKNIDLEQHVQTIKANMAEEVAKLLSAENVFEGSSETVRNAIKNKIAQNKDDIMLGLNYLTRWYNIDIKDTNIRDLITYNTRFFGTNASPLDTMIHLGRSAKKSTTSWNIYQGPWIDDVGLNELKMMYNPAVFKTALADSIGVSNILDFYKLLNDKFGQYENMEEWFKATTKAYIVESAIGPNKELSSANKTYERLSRSGSELNPYILPLLTAREGIYMIVNPAAISVGMSEKYVDMTLKEKNPEEFNKKVAEHKAQLERQAKHYETHYTFWYNMMDPEFRPKLERDILSVDNYNVKGAWRGIDTKTNSMLDFFMPMGIWINSHPSSAYADGSRVHFSTVDQLSDYGSAIYAHEMVHNNDGYAYFNGKGRRNNIGAEYFATGIFQPHNPGELAWENFTLNTMFDYKEHPNKDSDTRTVALSPERIDTPAELHDYVRKSLDVIYTLENAEADVLVATDNTAKKQWYNWIETVDSTDIKEKYPNLYKGNNNSLNVRHALDDERAAKLTDINALIDNEIISSTYGTGYHDIFGLQGTNTYYYAKLFEPIYATGENTKGAAGDLMFRRMAFEILGYKGYKDGLMPYVSNVLDGAAKQAGLAKATDPFVIKTVSANDYPTLKEFKKAMYAQRKEDATKLKAVTINYKGTNRTIANYEDLKAILQEAIEADLATGKRANSKEVKNKIYSAYLKATNDFEDSIYKQ